MKHSLAATHRCTFVRTFLRQIFFFFFKRCFFLLFFLCFLKLIICRLFLSWNKKSRNNCRVFSCDHHLPTAPSGEEPSASAWRAAPLSQQGLAKKPPLPPPPPLIAAQLYFLQAETAASNWLMNNFKRAVCCSSGGSPGGSDPAL